MIIYFVEYASVNDVQDYYKDYCEVSSISTICSSSYDEDTYYDIGFYVTPDDKWTDKN